MLTGFWVEANKHTGDREYMDASVCEARMIALGCEGMLEELENVGDADLKHQWIKRIRK